MNDKARIEIIVDRHRHAGVAVAKGSVIEVPPATARRLLNLRLGREVQVATLAENNNNGE